MSEEPKPPFHPTQPLIPPDRQESRGAMEQPSTTYGVDPYPSYPPANPNQNPQLGYLVPAAVTTINAPGRWRRWVGYNFLAFILSCIIFPLGCCIVAALAQVIVTDELSQLGNSVQQTVLFSLALGIPVFGTTMIASMIQRSALYHKVSGIAWLLGSATIGTVVFIAATGFFINFMLDHGSFDLALYIAGIGGIFAATSISISLFQWWLLDQFAQKAWHWPLIASATWTLLGTILMGFSVGALVYGFTH